MRTRYTKRIRSRRQRKTRRRNMRSRRRVQRGGWGGMSYAAPNKEKMSMMYGGWGPVMNGI